MNRFLHDDLRPQNVSFTLGRLEEVKEQAGLFFEAAKKLNNGTKLTHACQLTPPEIVTFPKIGNEITKPILLFMGMSLLVKTYLIKILRLPFGYSFALDCSSPGILCIQCMQVRVSHDSAIPSITCVGMDLQYAQL